MSIHVYCAAQMFASQWIRRRTMAGVGRCRSVTRTCEVGEMGDRAPGLLARAAVARGALAIPVTHDGTTTLNTDTQQFLRQKPPTKTRF